MDQWLIAGSDLVRAKPFQRLSGIWNRWIVVVCERVHLPKFCARVKLDFLFKAKIAEQ